MSLSSDSVCSPQNAENNIESGVPINKASATLLEAETVINTHNISSQVEGSDSLKDLLTDDYCHICEAVLLFESQRTSHYEGKKHAQKVRLYLQSKKAQNLNSEVPSLQSGPSTDKDKFCELCNMVFSSPVVARSHYEGKIHAKNLRRFRPMDSQQRTLSSGDATQPSLPHVPYEQEAEKVDDDDETPDVSQVNCTSFSTTMAGMAPQEVDLNDPSKHCRMCAATFNNPQMAQQHYSGRKHQRNQSRQRLLEEMGEDCDGASPLTCPICSITFTSVEMYQSHMQGNKHQVKEKKVADLCKSQKKVYDSFQDELADYIAVQKARGIKPSAAPPDTEKEAEQSEDTEKTAAPSAVHSHPPPALVPPSLFSIRFPTPPPRLGQPPPQSSANHLPQWGTGPPRVPPPGFWGRGYNQYSPNSLASMPPPGSLRRRPAKRKSPDWSSSSGSWSESSYGSSRSRSSSTDSSSGSSSSGSDDSRERRRRRRHRRGHHERGRRDKERVKKRRRRGARDKEEERYGESRSTERRAQHQDRNQGGVDDRKEEKHIRRRNKGRKEGEGRHKRRSASWEREDRKRGGERSKRRLHNEEEEEEESGSKRGRESDERRQATETETTAIEGGSVEIEEEGEGEDGTPGVGAAEEERAEARKDKYKHKHKKEKKRKDRPEELDTRTEEEKLWDETILGIF